jgi:hypothetical protein
MMIYLSRTHDEAAIPCLKHALLLSTNTEIRYLRECDNRMDRICESFRLTS